MAGGALDSNGVWLYGEDDQRDTFSALLNIGQDATSDAIGADRGRLAALENTGATGPGTAPVATASSGWALTQAIGRKKNGIAWVSIRVTRMDSIITVPADGNIGNMTIATLVAGWQAVAGMGFIAAASHDGRIVSGIIDTANVNITAVAPGANIAVGEALGLNACYPLA